MTAFSKHKNVYSGVEEVEQAWQNTGLTKKDNLERDAEILSEI